MAWEIMDAASCHLDDLVDLERQCFSSPWTREQLGAYLKGPGHELLIAVEDGRVLGYLGLMYVLDEGYISNVAVAPSCRRRGLGRALLQALLGRCRSLGLSFVTLEVRASNDAAIGLYSGQGFQAVGRRKGYYSQPREDALLMTYYF